MTEAITTKATETTVTNNAATQAEPEWIAFPIDLPDCNFQVIHLGASLLRSPLDIANSVDLYEWGAAARHLTELLHLLDLHTDAMIGRYGPRKFDDLQTDLHDLVEKPLRYGCATLQQLQIRLLDLINVSNKTKSEREEILANLLRDVEIDLEDNIPDAMIGRTLPSWALEAPELRSEKCLNQDCFKINEYDLNLVTMDIPYKLLAGVRKLKVDSAMGFPVKIELDMSGIAPRRVTVQ
ncbi:hypothetical protein F5Y12DRAFT_799664 [Xylaria sp. FL1777]|nr:hypothetical protein F5Y12DRAFT_799664 [Xylaria sp. FL1777]